VSTKIVLVIIDALAYHNHLGFQVQVYCKRFERTNVIGVSDEKIF